MASVEEILKEFEDRFDGALGSGGALWEEERDWLRTKLTEVAEAAASEVKHANAFEDKTAAWEAGREAERRRILEVLPERTTYPDLEDFERGQNAMLAQVRGLLTTPTEGGCCVKCEIYLDYKNAHQCNDGECPCHINKL